MADEIVLHYLQKWNVERGVVRLATRPVTHWIDGVPVESGDRIPVYEPSTGAHLTDTFEGGAGVVERAVRSSRKAFEGEWSAMRSLDRQALIFKLADLIAANQEELGLLESIDVGKPISQSGPIDIGASVDVLRYFAGWTTKISGRTGDMIAYDRQFMGMTLRQPVGVVAAVAPWNFPFQTLVWKIGAALAAGCAVVAKPSDLTPLTTLRLAELITQAGFPDGVFNVVNGTGSNTGAALVAHPGVDKVSFTGSTATGIKVGEAALQNMARLTLELGGKSPALVFADSDIDAVVEGLYNGIFFNAGQICDATSRAIVDATIYDEVRDRLVEKARNIKMLPGLDPESTMGPMASRAHFNSVTRFVNLARTDKLSFALDQTQTQNAGYFVGPAIIENPPRDHAVWRDEIFGPVLAISRAENSQDILEQAADTRYGLAAAIYSGNIDRVFSAARSLKAGTIYVNGHGFLDPAFPFGGLGMSGFGKDMGAEQMDAYLETKSVLISCIGVR